MSKHLILMLEYDEDDQYITRQHFEKYKGRIDIEIVNSSEEVMAYLSACNTGRKTTPSLFLFNYNATPLNAVELLQEVKKEKEFKHIPVVVLSGTIIPGIVKECYQSGASSFIQKPALLEDTDQKIQTFINYWFKTVELP